MIVKGFLIKENQSVGYFTGFSFYTGESVKWIFVSELGIEIDVAIDVFKELVIEFTIPIMNGV
jgi:hypothetical protein